MHLSSYFDPDTPDIVHRLVRRAKEVNPNLIVTIDPGYEWNFNEAFKPHSHRVMALSDLVFVDPAEFAVIEADRGRSVDDAGTPCVLDIPHGPTVIVMDMGRSATVHGWIDGRPVTRHVEPAIASDDPNAGSVAGLGGVFAATVMRLRFQPMIGLLEACGIALSVAARLSGETRDDVLERANGRLRNILAMNSA